MSLYFIPYLIIAAILYFLYLNESRRIKSLSPKAAVWSAYIIMWVFMGLRGHIMSDFILYHSFFGKCPDIFNLGISDFKIYFEPGYILYTALFKTICSNYFAWVAFSTFIDLIVFYYVFRRYCRSMILPLIFFIAFNGLLIEFNLYRNIKAIDLFLLSLPYLEKRKMLPYMVLNIIGSTFHSSAVLFIPLYFILSLRMPRWLMWGGFIVANVVYIFNISIVDSLLEHTAMFNHLEAYERVADYASATSEFKFSIGFIERTVSFILFTLLYNRLTAQKSCYTIFYNCFWMYYCSFLFLYEVSVLTERIPYLFMFSYWILYPAVVDLRYKYRHFVNWGIALLVMMKIITSYNVPPVKYENLITGISDYRTRKEIYFRFLRHSK